MDACVHVTRGSHILDLSQPASVCGCLRLRLLRIAAVDWIAQLGVKWGKDLSLSPGALLFSCKEGQNAVLPSC